MTLNIHSSIFFLLKKFIEHQFSYGSWEKLIHELGIPEMELDMKKSYPIEIYHSLLNAVSKSSNLTSNELQENFGKFMVPDLLVLYASYLKPEWKTCGLLENTEEVMHNAVRSNLADPPILNVSRVDDTLIIIDYYSKRRMASLAVGIIRGIAEFYSEQDMISVIPTTDLNDERVQIRVEFKK